MESALLGEVPIYTVLVKDTQQCVLSPLGTAYPQTQKCNFYEFMLGEILDKFTKRNMKVHTRTLFKITKSWKQHK